MRQRRDAPGRPVGRFHSSSQSLTLQPPRGAAEQAAARRSESHRASYLDNLPLIVRLCGCALANLLRLLALRRCSTCHPGFKPRFNPRPNDN